MVSEETNNEVEDCKKHLHLNERRKQNGSISIVPLPIVSLWKSYNHTGMKLKSKCIKTLYDWTECWTTEWHLELGRSFMKTVEIWKLPKILYCSF